MAVKVDRLEGVTGLFSGQGDLFIFDTLAEASYATASISTFTNPKSLGQIVQDSTSWDGEDPEVTELKDEQGNIITAKVAAGTLAFSFDIASTSSTMIEKFLRGVGITSTISSDSTPWVEDGIKITGFGHEIPVVTVPMAIVNDEKNKTWFYPKTKVTSNLAYADGIWRIHCACIAENINTTTLKTGMLIEAAVEYA